MKPFLWACLVLPILAQEFNGFVSSPLAPPGQGANIQWNATNGGDNDEPTINVTLSYSRNTGTPFGWIAFAWGNNPAVLQQQMNGGLDVMWCMSNGSVQRLYVTNTVGLNTAGGVIANGTCWEVNNGSSVSKHMNFVRTVECYGQPNCIPHTYGNPLIVIIHGPYSSGLPIGHQTGTVIQNVLDLGVAPPTPPTRARTAAPTGVPTDTPQFFVPGYPKGGAYNGGTIKLGWELLTNSVRFAILADGGSKYVGIGIQDPNVATKMTGEVFVAKEGELKPSSYSATYRVTPTLNGDQAAGWYTNGSYTSANGQVLMEFERALVAPKAGGISIADPTNVRLMMASSALAWNMQHTFSQEITVNLATGGQSTSNPRTPSARSKIAGIVIIGICCALGALFTYGLGHTLLGRWLFFRRICQNNKFMGNHTPTCFDLTWGQAILVTVYFGMITLFSRLEFGDQTDLRFLRCMGWTSTASLACASIPVSRQSILLYCFGMSFERAVLMHRIAARLAILLVLMHFVAVLIDPGYVPFQLIRDPIGDYKIVFAYGFFAFMLMLLVFVTSLPQIRRRFFEVFYYIHHVFIAIWVLAILHNSSALHQAILIVPFALWGIDRLVRCYRGRVRSHKLIKSQIIADALRLEFQGPITSCCPPVKTESGSYAFINCPAVSWLQWHPFSISSRADAENFTFHIKNMGAGTFTKALHDHFEKNPNAKVYVDGPYGHCAVRFEEYSSIVLVAGGVGVTPMAAILDDLYEKCKNGKKPPRLENVIFCWSVQAKETIQWMDELVKKIQASPEPVTGCRFDVQVFVTREKQDSAFYKAGRPKYETIFDGAERPKDGAGKDWNIGVLACGPEPMVCDVQKLSQIRKVDFHKEIFAF